MKLCTVEDETHAILQCPADDRFQAYRIQFWEEPAVVISGVQHRADLWDDAEKLRYMVHRPELAKSLGRLFYNVLRVYGGTPLFVPPRALIEGVE